MQQNQQSQTETSCLNLSVTKSLDFQNKNHEKTKKKNKKNKKSCHSQQPDQLKTVKKNYNKVEQEKIQSSKTTKHQNKQQNNQQKSKEPVKIPNLGKKIKRVNCKHISIYEKMFISIVLSIISVVVFAQPPARDYPIAQFQQGTHEPVFEIVTDRKTRFIKFNIQNSKPTYFGIQSVKTAQVKVGVEYSLGYNFKNRYDSMHENGLNQSSLVQLSDLKILSYSINNVTLQNRNDGFFNSWQFQDNEQLKNFVRQKYIKEMEEQTLAGITDKRKKMYEQKARFMLSNIITKYQSWFDWLLKRLDNIIQGTLEPYVDKIGQYYKEKR